MAFCFFEANDINKISKISEMDNFPLLCGTDQVQGFEQNAFVSGILVSLSVFHFATSFITANV